MFSAEEGEQGSEKTKEIQAVDKPESPQEELKKKAKSKNSDEVWGAAAMPILAYKPEYGGMFGAAGLLYRMPGKKKEEESKDSDPSSLVANAIWTTEKAVIAGLMADASVLDDRIKLELSADTLYLPSKFWGIGPNAYDKETYTAQEHTYAVRTGFQFLGSFYGGPMYEYGLYNAFDKRSEGQLASGGIVGAGGIAEVSGLGFRLFWDSVRGGFFPFDGVNAKATARLFREELGSTSDFTLLSVDGRGYINTLFSHVVAVQLLFQAATGEPPFQLLPSIGGESTMRGYYKDRFRDNVALSIRTEYRAPVTERFGLVGFFSLGQVASSVEEINDHTLKTAGGGGIRLTLQKRLGLNLRVDIACSEQGIFPYINVGEMF